MKMIPPRPPETSTGSERLVFDVLARLDFGPDAFALSSLNLSRHEHQRWGETDFVVVTTRGMLVLEVKGGLVTCSDGIWRFESRHHPAIEKAISPLVQARDAYFSLVDKHLVNGLGRNVVATAPSGFAVAYPFTPRRGSGGLVGGPEHPPQLVAFKEDLESADAASRFFSKAIQFWREQGGRKFGQWTPDEVRKVVGFLRPSFDRVPPLSIALARIRQEQFGLTEDQYQLLDFTELAPRIVCKARAGAGKTFLAVECMRREAHNSPLLVTGTDSLAPHLRHSNVAFPGQIVSFTELREQLAGRARKGGVLIVDEGQQLTNQQSIEVLGSVLEGGIEHGRWRWFTDPGNQVLMSSNFDPAWQDRLDDLALVAPLASNCRNTPQIVHDTSLVTGVAIGAARVKGNGPAVGYANSPDRAGMIAEAAAQLRRWLDDPDISPGHIVLLTPLRVEDSSIQEIARVAKVDFLHWHAGWDQAAHFPSRIGACTIDEFRGLEAPFAMVCDITSDTSEMERLLYLGMTRASFGLYVSCDSEARAVMVQRTLAALASQQ